ncbi:hypothetical protein TeGR_g14461 [Tetraparma gracilis]|uniref:YchJ-like middle NTF2-like domain-containing protein n=1 Tax=Tetraparma gracilis TaxID=2962635 RepID=A0ABQ6M5E3_9STRA|nr:hypothetical protein TeGR_g14461 [Tetraparma gracilis]
MTPSLLLTHPLLLCLLLLALLAAPARSFVVGAPAALPSTSLAAGGFAKPAQPAQPNKPSLPAYLATLPTRTPSPSSPCACKSSVPYASCCQPYHGDPLLCSPLPEIESPERCLRTRYSAFAGRLPLPLMRTVHEANGEWREDEAGWAKRMHEEGIFDGCEFVDLVVGEEEGESEGERFLSFEAVIKELDPRANGREVRLKERSRFLRVEGRGWLYAGGVVTDKDGTVVNA